MLHAIEKLAKGGSAKEVCVEYGLNEEGELRPVKKKEVKKDVLPDIRAIQLLMEEKDLSNLTMEELIRERDEIKKSLEGADGGRGTTRGENRGKGE